MRIQLIATGRRTGQPREATLFATYQRRTKRRIPLFVLAPRATGQRGPG